MEPTTTPVTDVTRLDDQELIRRARTGDADAFDAVAASRIPVAYRLASAILGPEAAAGATQNALLAAWRELPALRDHERFDAWFQGILINECRMQVRNQSRRRTVEIAETDPDAAPSSPRGVDASTLELVEVLDLLDQAFERLEPDDRAIVVLHHLDGRPQAEIATLLHMPVATVKWRLHQARGVLQHALEAVE